MKKIILTMGLLVLLQVGSAQSFAQDRTYISAGYGLGNYFGLISNTMQNTLEEEFANRNTASNGQITTNNVYNKNLGSIYGKLEYAVSPSCGIGFNFAYLRNQVGVTMKETYSDVAGNSYTDTETVEWDRTTYSVIMRINYHFPIDNENFDMYFGGGFGYRYGKWIANRRTSSTNSARTPSNEHENMSPLNWPLAAELTFGAKLNLTPAIGIYSEVGFAKSILQFGATVKL